SGNTHRRGGQAVFGRWGSGRLPRAPPPASPSPEGGGDGRGEGEKHADLATGDTAQERPLPGWFPPQSHGDQSEQKPSSSAAQRPTYGRGMGGWHDRHGCRA